MLIVHIITELRVGGAEKQLQQLVVNSDRGRFRHVVISLAERGPIGDELHAHQIEVHALGLRRALTSATALARLVSLLRRLRPDVVHCWLYHGCFVGIVAARLAGCSKVIWSLHSANSGLRGYGRMLRLMVRMCAMLSSRINGIIVVSHRCWQVHQQMGFATARMQMIANGVDVQNFSPNQAARLSVRKELGLKDDAILIGAFARYTPMKDHATLLRAGSRLRRRHPTAYFILAGRGIDWENQTLANLIQENGLYDAVSLLGERNDIPRLTAALDLACLSSWSESFGLVIAEAMASEVPCVVTDVGDLASLVGPSGRVVPPSDPEALAGALGDLLDLPVSARAILGREAREHVLSEFTIEKMVAAYEGFYKEIGRVSPAGAEEEKAAANVSLSSSKKVRSK